ncbi:aldehyde dehydrogenase [Candidatus Pelagibacter bacterium nBUS_49]|uniref:aldehyde dehydrogenase n=1 Tax=Candidatus Pelagibacter bacterium nBUS_49 TaxID=3374196 RepID=UPI003EBAB529
MATNYKAIAKKLKFEGRAFINGKYVSAIDGKKFETINPATGEKLCTVAKCNHKDVDLAVKVSRKAFNSGVWSRCSPEHRKEVLLKFAELLRKHGDENSVLECVDTGKLVTDCINEVANDAPMHFQWYGELIDKVFGKVGPTEPSITSLIVKEPIGVVAGIVPWNFPLMMAVWKMAPALAAGCSVIIKPAEDTPLTAIRVAQIGREAGIPDGVLNVLPGYGDVGEALGRHKDIDAVSFTGSTEVGGYFLKYSSESNLKPVALEMGGKSPFIVLEDAKINDDLIDHAINSAFWNGGQNCSANMRQIVHKKVKDEFLDKVIKRVKKLKVGDPLDLKSNMGSMISKNHLQTVDGYIQKGIDQGAKLLSGGVSNNKQKGFYAKPTLFDGLKENMTIAQEEIFGPVLGVLTVKDDNEALQVASNSKYGLHASVFTQDINRAFHLAKSLPCGTVSINTFSEGDIKTPFGGYKQSGSLSRDQGTEALNSFLQTKTIWISHQ